MPAYGQNSALNTAATQQAAEAQELSRIDAERRVANERYEARSRECYQKLAVTPCLNEARDERNAKLSDLKRQEVKINDVRRKRRAAERLAQTDERNSPQAQQDQAQRRGKAIQDTQERQMQADKKAQAQQERQSKPGPPARADEAAPSQQPLVKKGRAREAAQAKLPPTQRPGQAEKMALSRADADQREKELEERRAKLAAQLKEREQRKKPAAAPLPIPKD